MKGKEREMGTMLYAICYIYAIFLNSTLWPLFSSFSLANSFRRTNRIKSNLCNTSHSLWPLKRSIVDVCALPWRIRNAHGKCMGHIYIHRCVCKYSRVCFLLQCVPRCVCALFIKINFCLGSRTKVPKKRPRNTVPNCKQTEKTNNAAK